MSERVGPIEFDVETNTYRVRYDPQTIAPSVAVISALAEITASDTTDLPPLYRAIDPRGLDRLVGTPRHGADAREVRVSFQYQRWSISVSRTGHIEIRATDRTA
ncbi:HalOD1 output domain-containing protein [Natrinema caseinilyticum]|uniref:HalOD1 output domain-containing protein n=1 Tax=Natrinema caseinilyticum TaxID=2961570 RepID=UPI0020C1C114|nr:HalOD1 output domain-containing protein [Natrinema caseinilyticum]